MNVEMVEIAPDGAGNYTQVGRDTLAGGTVVTVMRRLLSDWCMVFNDVTGKWYLMGESHVYPRLTLDTQLPSRVIVG